MKFKDLAPGSVFRWASDKESIVCFEMVQAGQNDRPCWKFHGDHYYVVWGVHDEELNHDVVLVKAPE